VTPHIPSNHEVETFTGRYVDTKFPKPDMLCLEDIAHALSNTCRYGGHCQEFYSVAEHAVLVSKRLERQGASLAYQLGGLHHDDAEAYLGDIPRPMKKLLGRAYEILTERFDKAIVKALELPFSHQFLHDPVIKSADNWLLFVEAKHLLPSKGINWAGSQLDDWGVRQDGLPSRIVTPDYWTGPLPPKEAKALYLNRHKEIAS
jgi:hypothetical protein